MYSAYITKTNEDLKRTLLEGLEFIHWRERVKSDSTVFIKPNFTFPFHKKGVTTHPVLLKCLLEIVKNRANNIIIGESDGGNYSFKAEEAFRGHHMYEICKEIGVKIINLSNLPSTYVEAKILSKKVKIKLPKILIDDIDSFLSVPVMKVHAMTEISLSLKNLWGCYPDTLRCLYHQNLSNKLVLMAKILSPNLVIIDGLYALDGRGPIFGNPIKMDLILTSNNSIVADTLGAKIMCIPIEKVRHVILAEKEGLGTTNLENIRINTDWELYKRPFQVRKTVLDTVVSIPFNSYPAAKLIFDSPLTPVFKTIANAFRTKDERNLLKQMNTSKCYTRGTY